MLDKNFFKENIKTLFYALIIAIFIRSIFLQPFYIPSSSMEPNLLVGDRLFVTKYSYGYSKHSFPFSPPIFTGRVMFSEPKRGDVVVFKTPADNRTDYIKRLIGLPGDKIKMVSNEIFVNDKKISTKILLNEKYKFIDVQRIEEKLPNNRSYNVYEFVKPFLDFDTNNFSEVTVPENHFFVLGDNRDNSQDSRYIGFIPKNNLVGRAEMVFLSFDTEIGSFFNDDLEFTTFKNLCIKDQEKRNSAEKFAFKTGLHVIHPFSKKEIPIFFANYVLMDYGSGAIFGCPAHDKRDYDFALKNNLNIIKVKIADFSVDSKIDIFYSDQESFFPSSKHKYDAEALLIIEDKIALFSKDRDSLNTDLYLIDDTVKEKQELSSVANFNVNSLITGGDYDSDTGILALVSYSSRGEQYLILFEAILPCRYDLDGNE